MESIGGNMSQEENKMIIKFLKKRGFTDYEIRNLKKMDLKEFARRLGKK